MFKMHVNLNLQLFSKHFSQSEFSPHFSQYLFCKVMGLFSKQLFIKHVLLSSEVSLKWKGSESGNHIFSKLFGYRVSRDFVQERSVPRQAEEEIKYIRQLMANFPLSYWILVIYKRVQRLMELYFCISPWYLNLIFRFPWGRFEGGKQNKSTLY